MAGPWDISDTGAHTGAQQPHYSICGNENPVLDDALYNAFAPGGYRDIQTRKQHEQETREYALEQDLESDTTEVTDYWAGDN